MQTSPANARHVAEAGAAHTMMAQGAGRALTCINPNELGGTQWG
jgi:hypothetical protein